MDYLFISETKLHNVFLKGQFLIKGYRAPYRFIQFEKPYRELKCYKNLKNSSCIDLILINRPWSFQNSCVFETGVSNFHKMTITVMKMHFQKFQPRVINYRDYKHFQIENFKEDFLFELSKLNIRKNDDGFTGFVETYKETVNQHAHCK